MGKHTTKARLAPSPTGRMHLGNAWSFLIAWLATRLEGGEIILRMEDIDPQRSKAEWEQGILDDFAWLGITYDGNIIRQSQRNHIYENILKNFGSLIYPCYCTRKDLREVASAPQSQKTSTTKNLPQSIMPDMGSPYNGKCRGSTFLENNHTVRLACPPFNTQELEYLHKNFPHVTQQLNNFSFHDMVLGKQNMSLQDCGGDFALRRSDKVWAYQFAVSVDDAISGITQVVRGNDILTSTPRQLYLFSLLKYQAPQYAHIPLLLDEHGERLAKRHASMSLASMQEQGISSKEIISYLAYLMGINGKFYTAQDLLHTLAKHHNSFPWEVFQEKATGIFTKNFTK